MFVAKGSANILGSTGLANTGWPRNYKVFNGAGNLFFEGELKIDVLAFVGFEEVYGWVELL
jgi:hypothetical protein